MTVFLLILHLFLYGHAGSQNIYELDKYTPEEWIGLTAEEHLKALNTSNNLAPDRTFYGSFNPYDEKYKKWGYNYYDMYDRYENYANRKFENYRILENRRYLWSYNDFGDRLVKMTHFGSIWNDRAYDNGKSAISGPSGYINYFPSVVNFYSSEGVWVVRESTNDWAVSAIGADKLRTTLTPLTLSKAAMPGMAVNFQSANYQAKIVNSIITSGIYSNTMLRGFQFRRRFGALDLGATYATQYFQQLGRQNGTNWKGTVGESDTTPMIYLLRVIDDSPWNGNGPVIYKVRLKVDGVYRDDIVPSVITDNLDRERSSAVYPYTSSEAGASGSQLYLQENNAVRSNNIYTADENIPKYIDYLFLGDYLKGWNTKNVTYYMNIDMAKKYYGLKTSGDGPIKVNGRDYVVYMFDIMSIGGKVNRVQTEIEVSNDYRIQASEIYTENPMGGHDKSGDIQNYYQATPWRTMAVADGNVKDESNRRTVKIDFGSEVGNMVYGFDADFNRFGWKIRGEIVKNHHYYMFSDGLPGRGLPLMRVTDDTARSGHRSSITDMAWYLTFQKDWKKILLAGEAFKMGKFYRPHMYGHEQSSAGQVNIKNTFIDDNDDHDQFTDKGASDDDGVYPGQDIDNDGIPDNEKNMNGIPDYMEPFLMFDSDPDEFAFGDDFNNNTVPDFREDDVRFDTPYELDREGYHINLRYYPFKDIGFITGTLRSSGVGCDTKTFNDYIKFRATYDFLSIGSLFAEYRYEKIKDNIQDPYGDHTYGRDKYGEWIYQMSRNPDMLEYKDSKVNRLFLKSKIKVIPSITLENYAKFENNRQTGGKLYDDNFQLGNSIRTVAMSNKFAYTKGIGNFVFFIRCKIQVL